MSINLADFDESPYLVSDDFAVGHIFPVLTIDHIKGEAVPIPNSSKTSNKVVVYFTGCKKGWAANKKCLREIGRILGAVVDIDKHWIGASVQLKIVGDVRRPDGSRGNAIRVNGCWKKGEAPASKQASNTTKVDTTQT